MPSHEHPFVDRCLIALSLAAFIPCAESAQIVMANGDRITGEITQIWDGELTIEPEYADEFSVDVSEITEIIGDETFDLELADGTELAARLDGVDENGQQQIVTPTETLALPLVDIAELDAPEEFFEWDGAIDANSVVNEGNTDSRTFRIGATTFVKHGDHRHNGDLTLADQSIDGEQTKDQQLVTYQYGWLFRDPWLLRATASYERDPIRNLQARRIAGAGLGYELWDDADRRMTFSGGFGYQSEELADVSSDTSIAFWTLNFERRFRGGDLTLFHNHSINRGLSGRENMITKTSTGVRFDISDLFYMNFEIDADYESEPAPGAKGEDLAILAGFGLSFD